MKTQADILRTLIKNCFFAPNYNQLSVMLGQTGKMNIVRLMDETNNIGNRAVEHLWDSLCEILDMPDQVMCNLPQVWDLSNELKENEANLSLELLPDEWLPSYPISDFQRAKIADLYDIDPNLYYMLLALTYAKKRGFNPYVQKTPEASIQTVTEINDYLKAIYPQNKTAIEAIDEMLNILPEQENDSWWKIAYFGSVAIRLYHDPAYGNFIVSHTTAVMPFKNLQWWRQTDSNQPHDTLWCMCKDETFESCYHVLRIEYGQTLHQLAARTLYFYNNNVMRMIGEYAGEKMGMFIGWELFEEAPEQYTLDFITDKESEFANWLPESLTMLDKEHDNPELVARAKELSEEVQMDFLRRRNDEMELIRAEQYEVIDVLCSRVIVRLMYKDHDSNQIMSAEFLLSDYPALKTITPQDEVAIYRSVDNQLYAYWGEYGVQLLL